MKTVKRKIGLQKVQVRRSFTVKDILRSEFLEKTAPKRLYMGHRRFATPKFWLPLIFIILYYAGNLLVDELATRATHFSTRSSFIIPRFFLRSLEPIRGNLPRFASFGSLFYSLRFIFSACAFFLPARMQTEKNLMKWLLLGTVCILLVQLAGTIVIRMNGDSSSSSISRNSSRSPKLYGKAKTFLRINKQRPIDFSQQ